jgi:hypothetical protein
MYSDSIIYVSTKYSRQFSWGVIRVIFHFMQNGGKKSGKGSCNDVVA